MLERRAGRFTAGAAALAVLWSSPVIAALWAQAPPRNLVSFGGFEGAAISLRLPDVSPFPLVAGGWGARVGAGASVTTIGRDAFDGNRAVEIRARRGARAYLIQDLPLGTRSFRLQMAVQRVRGRQSLRLLGSWDRLEPESPQALIVLRLGGTGLRLITRTGEWKLATRLEPDQWVQLSLEVDARAQQLRVYRDGVLLAAVPAALEQAPQTLIVGTQAARAGRFRYDAVSVERLAELELAEVRAHAAGSLPPEQLAPVLARLDDAAVALSRGVDALAAPELRAALRRLERLQLGDAEQADGPRQLRERVQALLLLVLAS